MVFVN